MDHLCAHFDHKSIVLNHYSDQLVKFNNLIIMKQFHLYSDFSEPSKKFKRELIKIFLDLKRFVFQILAIICVLFGEKNLIAKNDH